MYYLVYENETFEEAVESHLNPNGFRRIQEAIDEAEIEESSKDWSVVDRHGLIVATKKKNYSL